MAIGRESLRRAAARVRWDAKYLTPVRRGPLLSSATTMIELREALAAAEARIQAVRDVHRHITVETRGATEPEHRCLDCCLQWPCPTIRALDA